MGYIRGVVHGVIVGTAIGVCVAPAEGARTRQQLRDATEQLRQGLSSAQETARRVMPQVRGAAETASGIVAGVRARVTHGEEDTPAGMELAGSPMAPPV